MTKMKLGLYVTHTIIFQNYEEKCNRISELVFELKKIFEELDINFRLLPQEIHIAYGGSEASAITTYIRGQYHHHLLINFP